MKSTFIRFGAIAFVLCFALQLNAQSTSLSSVFSAQVEDDEIDGFMGAVDEAFFNVQGDDDAFTVFSFVDFDTTSIPGTATAINSISLDLTQSNAFFTADGALEFFLASDTSPVDTNSLIRFLTNGSNVGAQVVGSQLGPLFSLGSGVFVETATGDVDNFALSLSAAGEAFAISQINSGGLLRVVVTPGDLGVQATVGGNAPFIDGVNSPVLNLDVETVPEPSSAAVLSLLALAGVCRRRR